MQMSALSSHYRSSAVRATPGRSSTFPSPAAARRPAVEEELPPYKKPCHPLDERAQDTLRALNGRSIAHIKEHSRKAGERVTDAVGLIQDCLHDQRIAVEKRRKRWENGIDTESQEEDEARLAMLQAEVDDSTKLLEECMRAVVDNDVAAQRIEEALDWLRQHAPGQLEREYQTQRTQQQSQRESQSQRRRTQNEDGEDLESQDSEGPTPGPTPLDGSRPSLTGASEMYADRMQRLRDDYTSISFTGRYSRNDAYTNFKRMLHDAKYRDEGQPLPDPDTWFTEPAPPALGVTGHGEDHDGDDDIIMERATISTKCPLTFLEFKDPYTSKKCPHTFERNAILELIRKSAARLGGGATGRGEPAVACPVTGCDQMLTNKDLVHDAILARKIKRMQEEKFREGEESEVEEQEEEDAEISVSQQTSRSSRPRVKTEPSSRARMPSHQ